MSFGRIKAGLVGAATCATGTAIGGGIYKLAANWMDWVAPAGVVEAAAIIGIGGFIYGVATSDKYGNNWVKKEFSLWLGMKIANEVQNDLATAMYNAQAHHDISGLQNTMGGLNHYAHQANLYASLAALARNVACGLVGSGILNAAFSAGFSSYEPAVTTMGVIKNAVVGTLFLASAQAVATEVEPLLPSAPRR